VGGSGENERERNRGILKEDIHGQFNEINQREGEAV
jgi:hypothetical protein